METQEEMVSGKIALYLLTERRIFWRIFVGQDRFCFIDGPLLVQIFGN